MDTQTERSRQAEVDRLLNIIRHIKQLVALDDSLRSAQQAQALERMRDGLHFMTSFKGRRYSMRIQAGRYSHQRRHVVVFYSAGWTHDRARDGYIHSHCDAPDHQCNSSACAIMAAKKLQQEVWREVQRLRRQG